MSEMTTYEKIKDSGIEWIGSIPSHWRVHTLYQLVTQVKEKNSNLQEKNLLSLSYGKIKRKDIDSPDGLLPASFDGYNIIEAGDIVLRLTDLQNDHTSLRVGLATERGIITSAYTTLRPIDTSNSKYLFYLLHAFDLKKGFYGMGSGVRQGLNYAEVKELRVVLPSQDEQNAIVRFLDNQCGQIDSVIEESKSSIAEYKKWKKSLISISVTQGIRSNPTLKDSGSPELGLIPKHYNIASVRWLLSVLTDYTANGSFGDLAKNVVYREQPDYARLVRLTDLRVDFSNDGVFVDEKAYNYLSKSSLYGGEILVANVGAYAGLAVEMPYVDFNATLGPNMFLVKTNADLWNQHFAYYSLIGDYCSQQLILRANNTTAQPKLNKDNFKSIVTVLPPIQEQREIAEYLDSQYEYIDLIIRKKEQLLLELEKYKRSLIFETVTGKRKVV